MNNLKTNRGNPKNFFASGLKNNHIHLAMAGREWLSLTQVVGAVSEKIPPEAKARWGAMYGGGCHAHKSLDVVMAHGAMDIVRLHLHRLTRTGKVEKHGSGKDAKYRWIETEVTPQDDPAGQDQVGRGHAVPPVPG